ncbi:MAG: hypothetical protein AMXMBFR13_09390 [Phycisphaerae bacterium]
MPNVLSPENPALANAFPLGGRGKSHRPRKDRFRQSITDLGLQGSYGNPQLAPHVPGEWGPGGILKKAAAVPASNARDKADGAQTLLARLYREPSQRLIDLKL